MPMINKYNTFLAQSNKDKKAKRKLIHHVGTIMQIKATAQSIKFKIEAKQHKEKIIYQKSIAQKTAAASMET
tara:strand:- start:174 stop:389 length:216 start_codon:yes stop_codon:yes gene_type:complete